MTRRRVFLGAMAGAPAFLKHGVSSASWRARIGLSLPFSGVQGGVAAEMLAGYQAAVRAGAATGVDVDLVVEDDKAKPDLTATFVRKFGSDRSFLATSGIVGTPHAKLAIPVARSAGLPVVGLRSGARELRDGANGVWHLRASYEDELARIVSMLKTTDSRVAIVYSDDAFGVSAVEHFKKLAEAQGVNVAGRIKAAERDGRNIAEMVKVATHAEVHASALLLLMITRPAIEGIAAARENKFMAPIYTMSFTAGTELLAAGPAVYRGVGLVSAFPLPRTATDELSESFRRSVISANKPDLIQSVTAVEGFLYGSTLVRAMARAGAQVTRQSLVQALETPPGISVAGEKLAWDPSRVGRHFLQVCSYDALGNLRS